MESFKARETLPVSRVGWRFSSAKQKAGENLRGRKYYPTLTQNKSHNEEKAKSIFVLCLDYQWGLLVDKVSRSKKKTTDYRNKEEK